VPTRAEGVDWNQVLLLPPIMHDLHYINATTLDLTLQVLVQSDWPEHRRFQADLAAQRAVASKGNISASFETVRRLVAEYDLLAIRNNLGDHLSGQLRRSSTGFGSTKSRSIACLRRCCASFRW